MPDTEILIIGGGIAGASTAYYLAQQGHRVTLLERGEVASEASGVNAGGLGGLGWGNSPDLQSYLTMGSLELFKSIQLDLGYDIEFRQSGSLRQFRPKNSTTSSAITFCVSGPRVTPWNCSLPGRRKLLNPK